MPGGRTLDSEREFDMIDAWDRTALARRFGSSGGRVFHASGRCALCVRSDLATMQLARDVPKFAYVASSVAKREFQRKSS